MSNGELTGIPTEIVSAKYARKQNQRWFTNHTNAITDYLWDLDREPIVGFPRSALSWWKRNKGYKKLSSRRVQHKKFNDDLFPHDPCPDDVKQGHIGSCWLLAAIGAVVALPNGPNYIKQMMKATPNHVIVRLFDKNGRARYIRMKRTILTHKPRRGRPLTLHAMGPKWVVMLEKAATAFTGRTDNHDRNFSPHDASYMNINGGVSNEGLKLLVGGEVTHDKLPTPKDSLAFKTARVLFEAPDVLFPVLYSMNSLATIWQKTTCLKNSSQKLITWAALFKEIFEDLPSLAGIKGNRTVFDKMVRSLAEIFVLQGYQLNLLKKFEAFYEARSQKVVCVNKCKRILRGAFRLNDFADFMSCSTEDERFNIEEIDQNIRSALLNWAGKSQLFPGKRGTGLYSREQLKLWRNVTSKLRNGHPVCLGTHHLVGATLDGRGHSSGEDVSRGLVGGHGYSVLGFHEKGNEKFLLVRNPWGKCGRGYFNHYVDDPTSFMGGRKTDLPDRNGKALMTPSQRYGGLRHITQHRHAFAVESGTFWFELADLAKRVNFIASTETPLII